MRYYPVSIDTRNKKVLIIGGGKVALRKVKTLLATEFTMYVIGAAFEEGLVELATLYPERVRLKGSYINRDFVFMGYDYVIIATNDARLNSHLEETALARHVPFVRCDKRSESSFIMSKVISHGDLTVSVSAGGFNPTLTELVTEDLEEVLKTLSPEKIRILNEIRDRLVEKDTPNIKQIMEDLYSKEMITLNSYLEDLHEYNSGDQGKQTGRDSNDDDKDDAGKDSPGLDGESEDHKDQG